MLPGDASRQDRAQPASPGADSHIDTSATLRLPGVKAVITDADVPKVYAGASGSPSSQDIVDYVGDEVAAVAALDEATAIEAARLIRVDYEPLPAVRRPEGGAKLPDAVHSIPRPRAISLGPGSRPWRGRITPCAAASHVRTDQYTTAASHNCYAEFHVGGRGLVRGPTSFGLDAHADRAAVPESIARAVGLTDAQCES